MAKPSTWVGFGTGIDAANEIEQLKPDNATMAQFALRWILMFDAVSCAIPGAKNPKQAEDNAAAAELPPLSDEQMQRIEDIYNESIRGQVHHRW